MGKFFTGATGKQVEVNKRGIMADIELENSAYAGKKVSRADLIDNENEEDESEEGDDDAEEGEEEFDEEDGESQLSESSSESVAGDLLRADGMSDDSGDEET